MIWRALSLLPRLVAAALAHIACGVSWLVLPRAAHRSVWRRPFWCRLWVHYDEVIDQHFSHQMPGGCYSPGYRRLIGQTVRCQFCSRVRYEGIPR